MIQRQYVTCNVCGTHHTLRIQMGYGAEQSHRFLCHHCSEPIALEFPSERNGHRMVLTGASPADSAETTNYQYLSPDFVADDAEARNPFYFGSMELISKLGESQQAGQGMATITAGGVAWNPLTDAPSDWEILQRCWRLERRGRYDLAGAQLEKLAKRDGQETISAWLAITGFTEKIFPTDDPLMSAVVQIHEDRPEEFARMVMAYEYEWKKSLREGQMQVFAEFFRRWADLSQVYLYVRADIDMPKIPIATSVNYEAIRGFYAVAQEYFASQVVLLTALNNIKAGRRFDELKHITLQKYRNSDNAKRRENFIAVPVFAAASIEYDSGLRNAEVHNWISLLPDGHTLSYGRGGDGSEVRLGYVSYLLKSVRLFKQIACSCMSSIFSRKPPGVWLVRSCGPRLHELIERTGWPSFPLSFSGFLRVTVARTYNR